MEGEELAGVPCTPDPAGMHGVVSSGTHCTGILGFFPSLPLGCTSVVAVHQQGAAGTTCPFGVGLVTLLLQSGRHGSSDPGQAFRGFSWLASGVDMLESVKMVHGGV